MLPSGKPVQEVVLGGNGLILGFKPGSLLLDTSSSEPDLTIETAKVSATASNPQLSACGIWSEGVLCV